jgi:hypothetical protein
MWLSYYDTLDVEVADDARTEPRAVFLLMSPAKKPKHLFRFQVGEDFGEDLDSKM